MSGSCLGQTLVALLFAGAGSVLVRSPQGAQCLRLTQSRTAHTSSAVAPAGHPGRRAAAPPQPQLRRTTACALTYAAHRRKPAAQCQRAPAAAAVAALMCSMASAAEAAVDSTLRGAAYVEAYAKTDPALQTFEPRGITPEDTVVFIIGSVPFVWATIEFWRRIAFGESFGTGKDSVIINDTSGKRKKPQQRVLGQDAITAAYILFALAGASAVLVVVAGVDVLGL